MPAIPRISGLALSALARFARTKTGAIALERLFRTELRIDALARLSEDARGPLPLQTSALQARPPRRATSSESLSPPPAPWSTSSDVLIRRYRAGTSSPADVVRRVLDGARALERMTPAMGPFLDYREAAAHREASASEARWKGGRQLGPLDGVPVAIKEQTAVEGMPRQSGAPYLPPHPMPEDATLVARLRAQGAIVIGTTSMTEHGMTPTGANPHRTMPRNPHATDCLPGGSSTGSGVAVATGLVPMALAADGGGSIRIPSALNGVFGLKPTWGRLSRHGDASTGSVAHLGPIASSTLDLARALEAMAGEDPLDRETLGQSQAPGSFVQAIGRGVKGLVIGVEEREWRDAETNVAAAGQDALRALEREGARLTSVSIPLAAHAPSIGYVTIATEARAALHAEWRDHADAMGPDLQVSFSLLDALSAPEYLDAQRLRSGLRRDVARVLGEADLVALPTVSMAAPTVTDAEMAGGFLDAKTIDGLCRFTFLANLTGLPASSAPVGLDTRGRPLALQLVGDAWDEATVFAALAHLERVGAARAEKPRVAVSLLD